MSATPKTTERLIRLPAVRDMTGLSGAAIYRAMQRDTFPQSVALGPNARAWRQSEIQAWIAARIAARDTGADAELRIVSPNIGRGRPGKSEEQRAA